MSGSPRTLLRRVRSAPPRTSQPLASPLLGVLRTIPGQTPHDRAAPLDRATPPALPAPSQRTFADGSRAWPITGLLTTIGRDLRNTVVLLDPAASREHACLRLTGGAWSIENVSSANVVHVGATTLRPGECADLPAGETFSLGETHIQLVAPATPTPALSPSHGVRNASPHSADDGETSLLDPGVTLSFAFTARRGQHEWWAGAVAAVLLLLVCTVVTIGVTALAGRDAFTLGGPRQVFAALTLPLVPDLGVALLVAALDRYEREPPVMLLAAFAWGALIAVPPALVFETSVSHALGSGVAAAGPASDLLRATLLAGSTGLVEEVVKGAGLLALLLALRDEFDNVTDGVLYGLVIGAGFGMVENFVYFAQSPRDQLAFLVVGRVALGWLSHSTYTALIGIGLGLAREAHRRCWRPTLLGLLAAVLLHAVFDFVVLATPIAAHVGPLAGHPTLVAAGTLMCAYGPLFAVQLALLRQTLAALRREAEVVRAHLADEVLAGAVMLEEYMLAQDAARGNALERDILLARGLAAYLVARALRQTAIGLAFRKWHVACGDPPKPSARQPEDLYRTRVAKLRASLARRLARDVSPASAP
jgi:RsiW-degrading membrane proteinase PrsW (M82 family)